MAELEVILDRIEFLGRDLDAVDVGKQETKSPDKGKRDAASYELRQLYENSDWYTARYAAGYSLFSHELNDPEEAKEMLNDFIPLWINDLRSRLESVTSAARPVRENHLTQDRMFYDLVDQKKRIDAVIDAGGLYRQSGSSVAGSFLRSIYDGEYDYLLEKGLESVDIEGNPFTMGLSSRVREQAGRQLGYSGLRVWFHEDPCEAAASAALLAAGMTITAFAGYMLLTNTAHFFQ